MEQNSDVGQHAPNDLNVQNSVVGRMSTLGVFLNGIEAAFMLHPK